MRKVLGILALGVVLSLSACEGSEDGTDAGMGRDTQGDSGSDAQGGGKETQGGKDLAPESLKGYKIEFVESEHNVENVWTFGADKATLQDVGDFPYTYKKKDGTHSTVIFDVQGKDKYEMTWTSTDGGTCTESFEGSDGWSEPSPCTFQVLK